MAEDQEELRRLQLEVTTLRNRIKTLESREKAAYESKLHAEMKKKDEIINAQKAQIEKLMLTSSAPPPQNENQTVDMNKVEDGLEALKLEGTEVQDEEMTDEQEDEDMEIRRKRKRYMKNMYGNELQVTEEQHPSRAILTPSSRKH